MTSDRVIKRLSDRMSEPLNWSQTPFSYDNMVRLYTIADGSCFFHAVVGAFYLPYQTQLEDGKRFDRRKFIKNLRRDLSIKLDKPEADGKTPYDKLSGGELLNTSNIMGEPEANKYKVENMKKQLDSEEWSWQLYIEYISNQLNKDIYILDDINQDVFQEDFDFDEDLYHKERDSVVVLYLGDHFETVGLDLNGKIHTLFDPNSHFISSIRMRLKEKTISK